MPTVKLVNPVGAHILEELGVDDLEVGDTTSVSDTDLRSFIRYPSFLLLEEGDGTDADEPADDAAGAGDDEPVTSVKGIGPARAEFLAEQGIETVADLLAYDGDDEEVLELKAKAE